MSGVRTPQHPPEFGAVVQLVRIPACHAGGRGFESRPLRQLSTAMLGNTSRHAEPRIRSLTKHNMLQNIGDSCKASDGSPMWCWASLALVFAAWGAYGIVDHQLRSGRLRREGERREDLRRRGRARHGCAQQPQWQQRFGGESCRRASARLQDHLLEGLVRNSLLTQRTRELGYRVSDAAARRGPAQRARVPASTANTTRTRPRRASPRPACRVQEFEADRCSSPCSARSSQNAIARIRFRHAARARARLPRSKTSSAKCATRLLPPEKFAAGAQGRRRGGFRRTTKRTSRSS